MAILTQPADNSEPERTRRHLRLVPATLDLTGPIPLIGGVPVYPIFGSLLNGNLAPHHLEMLAASGITPEHAARRGYETITDKRRLAELKIVTAARSHVPGLLVPLLRPDRSHVGLPVPAR